MEFGRELRHDAKGLHEPRVGHQFPGSWWELLESLHAYQIPKTQRLVVPRKAHDIFPSHTMILNCFTPAEIHGTHDAANLVKQPSPIPLPHIFLLPPLHTGLLDCSSIWLVALLGVGGKSKTKGLASWLELASLAQKFH